MLPFSILLCARDEFVKVLAFLATENQWAWGQRAGPVGPPFRSLQGGPTHRHTPSSGAGGGYSEGLHGRTQEFPLGGSTSWSQATEPAASSGGARSNFILG